MQIEAVTQASIAQLEAGLMALAADLGDAYKASSETLERALFADQPASYGALACEARAVRGVALYAPMMSTALGCPGVYVSDLWVAPESRGAGLGAALLSWVARDAKSRWGAGFLRLVAYEDTPRAIAFYKGLGFDQPAGEAALRLTGANFNELVRTI